MGNELYAAARADVNKQVTPIVGSGYDVLMPRSTDRLNVFGAIIRKLRLRRGLSQYALADLSGLHRNYIAGIEQGKRNLGLKNILRLAEALKVKPVVLFRKF